MKVKITQNRKHLCYTWVILERVDGERITPAQWHGFVTGVEQVRTAMGFPYEQDPYRLRLRVGLTLEGPELDIVRAYMKGYLNGRASTDKRIEASKWQAKA